MSALGSACEECGTVLEYGNSIWVSVGDRSHLVSQCIAALRGRATKAEADRDEARARADAAESETVRRIVGWLRREHRYDNPLNALDLADEIERGDWKEPGT